MQTPLGTGFGPQTTAVEVLGDQRLDGRTVLITGGHAGLGLAAAQALEAAGATVITGSRATGLNLTDPASIDAFAARHRDRVDVLINNAGVMAAPLTRDARGYELHLSTNHLGHFQLTQRLGTLGRVVNVSSLGHQIASVDFDDPDFERRPYDKWVAYGQSKTANVLFTVALAARGVAAFAVHPGEILTGLARHLSDAELKAMGVGTKTLKTVEQGAATTVWAATSPLLDGRSGLYCEDADVAEVLEGRADHGVRPYALDPEAAERLWALSEARVR
jgi:NAD(P)-dependent dehydrogenase (short-subunit alcohol dehydrogenase family)